jgi:hypothetical protein
VQGSTAASLQILQLSLLIPFVTYVVGIKAVVVASVSVAGVAVTVETAFPRPLPLLLSLKFSPLTQLPDCSVLFYCRSAASAVLLSRMQMYARMYLRVGSERTSRPVYQNCMAQTSERSYISKTQPITNQTKN